MDSTFPLNSLSRSTQPCIAHPSSNQKNLSNKKRKRGQDVKKHKDPKHICLLESEEGLEPPLLAPLPGIPSPSSPNEKQESPPISSIPLSLPLPLPLPLPPLPPISSTSLKLKTYFQCEDKLCSLQAGRWPSTFMDPCECYEEVKEYLVSASGNVSIDANGDTVSPDTHHIYNSRDICFFSDESKGYNYGNKLSGNCNLTPKMRQLLQQVNEAMGTSFNGILVNRYKSGHNSIGPHSDDEAVLEPAGVFAICIYPEYKKGSSLKPPSRIFRLFTRLYRDNTVLFTIPGSIASVKKTFPKRDDAHEIYNDKHQQIYDFDMKHLDCLWMQGEAFQDRFKHSVPPQLKVDDCRVSFTFRKHAE